MHQPLKVYASCAGHSGASSASRKDGRQRYREKKQQGTVAEHGHALKTNVVTYVTLFTLAWMRLFPELIGNPRTSPAIDPFEKIIRNFLCYPSLQPTMHEDSFSSGANT
jgi:hypothetical protein